MTQIDSSSVPSVPLLAGIDVAKETLDLARSDTGEVLTFANDDQGIRRIIQLLTGARGIVVESTGGLERPLVEALLEASLPVALVHPGRVRYFAIGCGILAKTDPIDAGVLMKFAQLAQPRLAQKRSANQSELDSLITCRRQLCTTRVQQSNCKLTTTSKRALKSIDAILGALNKQIDKLDKQIRELIDSDDDFKDLDRQLRSVPGVGPVLSSTLIAELPELGSTDSKRLSALVGVAPFNRDSGKSKGKRSIRGGRRQVRNVLYMSAVSAIRCNPILRRFAERLKQSGKAPKVIIVAAMRKLLGMLNAMVRDNLLWNELTVVKALDL